jgi:hypothetical protein
MLTLGGAAAHCHKKTFIVLQVADGVKQWLFDKDTALYLLYLQRKRKGLPLVSMAPLHNLMSISPGIHVSLEGGLDNSDLLTLGHNSPCNTPKTPARKLDSTPLNSKSPQFID